MSIKTDLIGDLKKSLKDSRCARGILYLEEILERKFEDGDIEYRMLDRDYNEVKTVDDVIGLISEEDVRFTLPVTRVRRYTNDATSVRLVLTNLFVNIKRIKEDEVLARTHFFGLYHPTFTLAYQNDNDSDLKMKLIYTGLCPTDNPDDDPEAETKINTIKY